MIVPSTSESGLVAPLELDSSMIKVTLRPATPEDTDFARNVHRDAYHDVVVRQFGDWDDEAQGSYFASSWDHPGFEIVSYDGKPCGYSRIEKGDGAIHAHELVLLPEVQGKGIGTACLVEAQKRATKQDVPIQLEVLKFNRAAELYERMGFIKIGETDTHNQMEWRSSAL